MVRDVQSCFMLSILIFALSPAFDISCSFFAAKATGEALVSFLSPTEASRAGQAKNNQLLGTRYIEVCLQERMS